MKVIRANQPVHSVDLLFSFILFLLFATTGISIVLIGSQVYGSATTQMEETYTSRTALSYVSEKIRQCDSSGAIELTQPEGFADNALLLHENIAGNGYDTFIYFYDGALRELFVKNGTKITPEQGTSIVSLRSFTIEEIGEKFYLLSTTEKSGKTNRVMMHQKTN